MTRFRLSNLRFRIWCLILVAALPAAGLALYESLRERAESALATEQRLLGLIEAASIQHRQLVSHTRQLLMLLAQSPQLRSGAASCNELVAELLTYHTELYAYGNLGATDREGQVFCSAKALAAPVNFADRNFFQRALATGDFVIGGFVMGRIIGRPVLNLSYPIRDGAGQVQGIVFAGLDLEWLSSFFTKVARLPAGGTISVIDGEGLVLARYPEPERWVGKRLPESELSGIVHTRQQGVAEATGLDGVRRLYAFTMLHAGLSAGEETYVTFGVPVSVITAKAKAGLASNLQALALVALLALVAIWIGGERMILRPVQALIATTRRLRAGDLGARSEVLPGQGEFSELGEAFDTMAAALEERQTQLEHAAEALQQAHTALEVRVKERTAELEAANTALRESEERFRQLAENIREVFWMTSVDWSEVLYVSPAYEEIWGRPCAQLYAEPKSWMNAIHPADRDEVLAAPEKGFQGGVYDVEYRITRPDGSIRWIRDRGFPIRDRSGQVYRVAGIAEDITEQKFAADEVREAKDEAERANQAKSEFLSRMSHELRTPLNAVLGFAQLLEMDTLSPDQRESVDQILKGGRHLLGLINEVLDITRIETGHLSLSLEPVHLRDTLQDLLALVQPLAAPRKIALRVETSGAWEQHVLADPQRLKQVLLNLLSNAIKFNRAEGTVTLECEVTSESRLRVQVRDTGPGIPPEKFPRLFTPFDRLGAEQTGIEGTGLGLALSKRLVEAMRGTMGVVSTLGEGSTFWLELALVESPVERYEHLSEAGPESPTAVKGHARTLLYIEDNLSNLQLLERVLSRRPGVRLLSAMQGELGLELAREHRPDLVVLDLHLPDMPGEEVVRRIQADRRTRDIPVMVLSADATPGHIERLRAAGIRDYLTKPLDVQRFLQVIDNILSEEHPR